MGELVLKWPRNQFAYVPLIFRLFFIRFWAVLLVLGLIRKVVEKSIVTVITGLFIL